MFKSKAQGKEEIKKAEEEPKPKEETNMNQTFSFVKKTTNTENKPPEAGKGFSFIKKTTPGVNESFNNDIPETRQSDSNINISNFNNLDQFLSENENILLGRKEEEKIEQKVEQEPVKPSFGFIKKEEPKKGGFNFIKKKDVVEEKQTDNDISEIKSIYSQTNNFVNDDISVNLEEETQKSAHNTSYVDNRSVQEGLRAVYSGSVKSDKAETNEGRIAMAYEEKIQEPPKTSSKKELEHVVTIKREDIISPKAKVEDMLQSKDALDNLIYKIHNIKVKIKDKNKEVKVLEELLEINIHKEEEAIHNNDFDRAQEIENTICETRERLSKIKLSLEELNKEMSKLRNSELIVIRHRTKVLEESINSANQLFKTRQNEMIEFENKESKKHSSDNIKITKLKEKLDFLQANLKTEKDVKYNKISTSTRKRVNSII